MSIPTAANLPLELRYLAPALRGLARIPAGELNEQVETSVLDGALRERVKGLKLPDAIAVLTEDVKVFKNWLKEEKIDEDWAIWVSAYLMRPGPLARNLLFPRAIPTSPQSQQIAMELPAEWTSEAIVGYLIVRSGKILCKISPLNELEYRGRINQNEARERAQNDCKNPLAYPGKWSRSSVRFGESTGNKYSYAQTASVNWQALEYLLAVDGGFVHANVSHEQGKDFDERVLEAKFHTLKIVSPG